MGVGIVDQERRVEVESLEAFITSLFRAAGMREGDAVLLTAIIVRTDLRGAYSHGCALAAGYLDRMIKGLIDPGAEPTVARDNGSALAIDGHNAIGHIATDFAMRKAIERARDTGLAAAAVGGSNHCGAMAHYAMLALPQDMIGLATTNGLPTMAFWGGLDRILSINPIGIAIPAGRERPFVLDTSFGAAARGKILVHHQAGRQLPEGWALDQDGNPTTDPAIALQGLIAPSGGYKGTSLALVMGILAALLSGAAYGTELGNFVEGPKAGRDGQFVLAINVSAFVDPGRFKDRMDEIIRQIHASRPAPGFDRVVLPGEHAVELEAEYRRDGVPVTEATRKALADVAERLGVDPGPIQ
jgi:LDH2 family malate/lactate/ureidoglycolate dehydrogenase